MPVKPLPRKLVKRLRRVVREATGRHGERRVYATLTRMKNIDHRQQRRAREHKSILNMPGRRVRQPDVSRNFPGVEVAIKRTHSGTAKETIKCVKRKVRLHNLMYRPRNYRLLMPKAYAIGEHLIAMSKTDVPNMVEIFSGGVRGQTRRGARFFKALKKWHPEITEDKLRKAAETVEARTKIDMRNIMLLDFRKGKFEFMPLIDIF